MIGENTDENLERLLHSYNIFTERNMCLRMDTQEDVRRIKEILNTIINSTTHPKDILGINFIDYESGAYNLPSIIWFDEFSNTLTDHQDSNPDPDSNTHTYRDSYGNMWPDIEYSEYYRRGVTVDVFINPEDYPEYFI